MSNIQSSWKTNALSEFILQLNYWNTTTTNYQHIQWVVVWFTKKMMKMIFMVIFTDYHCRSRSRCHCRCHAFVLRMDAKEWHRRIDDTYRTQQTINQSIILCYNHLTWLVHIDESMVRILLEWWVVAYKIYQLFLFALLNELVELWINLIPFFVVQFQP